jgi:hypothetical protein
MSPKKPKSNCLLSSHKAVQHTYLRSKVLKKQEVAPIAMLVERAMAVDPRLKTA